MKTYKKIIIVILLLIVFTTIIELTDNKVNISIIEGDLISFDYDLFKEKFSKKLKVDDLSGIYINSSENGFKIKIREGDPLQFDSSLIIKNSDKSYNEFNLLTFEKKYVLYMGDRTENIEGLQLTLESLITILDNSDWSLIISELIEDDTIQLTFLPDIINITNIEEELGHLTFIYDDNKIFRFLDYIPQDESDTFLKVIVDHHDEGGYGKPSRQTLYIKFNF